MRGVFSSLTNTVQIACRMTTGGSTLNQAIPCCLWWFYFCCSNSVKIQLPDLFFCWMYRRQHHAEDVCHCGHHCSPYLPATRCNQALLLSSGSFFPPRRRYVSFTCCFHPYLYPSVENNEETSSGWGECCWRWHSRLWYSNRAIHQQASLKHRHKPAGPWWPVRRLLFGLKTQLQSEAVVILDT